jgi:hypothetical protein
MENNRETAGGAATPHRLMVSPQQAAAGASLIAQGGRNGQPRSGLAYRLEARHGLPEALAAVIAEKIGEVAHER